MFEIIITKKMVDCCPICGNKLILEPHRRVYLHDIEEVGAIEMGTKCFYCKSHIIKGLNMNKLPEGIAIYIEG